jgi:hypothetical protein
MRTDFEQGPALDGDGDDDGSLSDELRPRRLKRLPGDKGGTPLPPTQREQIDFHFWRTLARNLALVSLLAGIPMTVALGLTLSFWLASGIPALHAARLATVTAEDEYHRELRSSQPLIQALASLGSPREQVEAMYFAFEDAPSDLQRRLADQYLGTLVDQLNVVADTPSELPMQARSLLQPALAARGRTHEAYVGWKALVDTPQGWALTALWVVAPPSAGMEVYERPNTRKLLPPADPGGR